MKKKSYKRPWTVLKKRLVKNDLKEVLEFLDGVSVLDKARAISHLAKEDQRSLLTLLGPDKAADLLQDLSDEQAAHLIETVPVREAANIVDQLPLSEQADILQEVISDDKADAIIQTMLPSDAKEIRQILKYPENTAGGIMSTEYLSYQSTMTVGVIIDDMQKNSTKYSDYNVQYTYIVSNEGRLEGVLRLRDLLLSSREKTVSEIMIKNPVRVSVSATLDELIEFFENYSFLAVPVVNENDCLVGIAKRYEVVEAQGERGRDTYLKASGIVGGEELRSMPLFYRAKRRLSWLSVNIILNIIAASVIAFYQETLSAVIVLAVFLPIISDMSGCSGFQAVAVSIRELTLGIVKPLDLFRVLFKEMWVGIINGIVLGVLLGCVAALWKQNLYLGLVVGGALAVNTIVAVIVGGIIPLILQKMNKDPALASGPILTTITDMCGFFFALKFATLLLPLLQ